MGWEVWVMVVRNVWVMAVGDIDRRVGYCMWVLHADEGGQG